MMSKDPKFRPQHQRPNKVILVKQLVQSTWLVVGLYYLLFIIKAVTNNNNVKRTDQTVPGPTRYAFLGLPALLKGVKIVASDLGLAAS